MIKRFGTLQRRPLGASREARRGVRSVPLFLSLGAVSMVLRGSRGLLICSIAMALGAAPLPQWAQELGRQP